MACFAQRPETRRCCAASKGLGSTGASTPSASRTSPRTCQCSRGVDARERIRGRLDDVDRVGLRRGSCTALDAGTLAAGEDVARPTFPDPVRDRRRKLTIYCTAGERTGSRPRTAGRRAAPSRGRAARPRCRGSTGCSGAGAGGVRTLTPRCRLPMTIVAVGARGRLRNDPSRAPANPAAADRQPRGESRSSLKHDGELLEPLPTVASPRLENRMSQTTVWTRRSAQADASAHITRWGALHHPGPPTAASRRRGRRRRSGEWGFSSDERPYGDRSAAWPAIGRRTRCTSTGRRRSPRSGRWSTSDFAARRRHRRARAGLPRSRPDIAEQGSYPRSPGGRPPPSRACREAPRSRVARLGGYQMPWGRSTGWRFSRPIRTPCLRGCRSRRCPRRSVLGRQRRLGARRGGPAGSVRGRPAPRPRAVRPGRFRALRGRIEGLRAAHPDAEVLDARQGRRSRIPVRSWPPCVSMPASRMRLVIFDSLDHLSAGGRRQGAGSASSLARVPCCSIVGGRVLVAHAVPPLAGPAAGPRRHDAVRPRARPTTAPDRKGGGPSPGSPGQRFTLQPMRPSRS